LAETEKRKSLTFDVSVTSSVRVALERAEARSVDIFVVDLGLPDERRSGQIETNVGLKLIPHLTRNEDCGVIVYSAEAKAAYFMLTMEAGVDDYIEKTDGAEFVVAKIISVWRRIQSARTERENLEKFRGRSFQIGDWTGNYALELANER
jgi:DNA-binding response OmpR family regulator